LEVTALDDYRIDVPDAELEELRAPGHNTGARRAGRAQLDAGTDVDVMREVVRHW
jgi:hypothetical protein